jgi:hypothetical protein
VEDHRDQRSEEGVKSAGNPLGDKSEIFIPAFAACFELAEETSFTFYHDSLKGTNEAGLKISIEPVKDGLGRLRDVAAEDTSVFDVEGRAVGLVVKDTAD